ncbi:MAG: sigma 54-interacting transcriptional regulator [Desulfobacterales bacterium]|jgi:arginine utilization regulatory protein
MATSTERLVNNLCKNPGKLEKLLTQKDLLEAILNHIDEAIFVMDVRGHIIYLNQKAEELEGFCMQNAENKHIHEVYIGSDQNYSRLWETIKSGRPIVNVHCIYPTAKKLQNIIASNYPLHVNGRLVGGVCIYQDIEAYRESAQKKVEYLKNIDSPDVRSSEKKEPAQLSTFGDIIGGSDILQSAVTLAKSTARSDSSILIYGETGTGKELFAQSIHNASHRSGKSFMAINCAAIPENLLEGILFGTSKGVYTGALDKTGLFEQANGGTVFLDEINSMPLSLQAKIMRVLQEKKVRRLGHQEEKSVDFRIISSCNQEPNVAIEQQQLRSDLFYRLAVVYLMLPPLRRRTEDILTLCEHFIEQYNHRLHKKVNALHPDVISTFLDYDWPGNVRHLKHCIESAMNIVAVDATVIQPYHLPAYMGLFSNPQSEYSTASALPVDKEISSNGLFDIMDDDNMIMKLQAEEKKTIIQTMQANKGNITKTANQLKISRQRLQYRLKKYGLKHLSSYINYSSVIGSQRH